MGFNLTDWTESVRKNQKELLFFSGQITPDVVTEHIEKIESLSQEMTLPRSLEKKMMHVAVESIQNLFHHSCKDVENPEMKNFGFFLLSIKDNNLFLTTGNFIKEEQVLFLKNRLEQLNALDIEEIKKLYKIILNGTKLSKKGGGGLGMIDIIKKTKQKLKYHFYDVNDDYGFYEFRVKIGEVEQ